MNLSTKLARWHLVRECVAAIAIACCLTVAGAWADEAAKEHAASGSKATPIGEVAFDFPGLPDASIEVDLSEGMFKDMFGLGSAMISGAADGVVKAIAAQGNAEEAHATADQLQAVRQIFDVAGKVVSGVHVREYDEGTPLAIKEVTAHFSKKLNAENWETVIRVRSEDELYVVNVLRVDGAIKGLFLIIRDDESTVLANVVCDLSPEVAQKLASAAAAAGARISSADGTPFSIANLFLHGDCSVDPSVAGAVHAKFVEVPAPVGDKTE